MPEHKAIDKPWRVTSSFVEHQTPFFSVLNEDVLVSDGTRRTYYVISFPRPAVGVLARRGTDILLIRQYRFIVDEFVWAIPSGGVAEGESLTEAARRELEEETGYTAPHLRPFLTSYASYGCSNQRFEIFLADSVEQVPRDFDRSEVLEARWFTREELLRLVENNGIVDSLSLSPILLLLLRGDRI